MAKLRGTFEKQLKKNSKKKTVNSGGSLPTAEDHSGPHEGTLNKTMVADPFQLKSTKAIDLNATFDFGGAAIYGGRSSNLLNQTLGGADESDRKGRSAKKPRTGWFGRKITEEAST